MIISNTIVLIIFGSVIGYILGEVFMALIKETKDRHKIKAFFKANGVKKPYQKTLLKRSNREFTMALIDSVECSKRGSRL